ncbi:hypothetical protein P8452_13190 [Trifolium repens]|nr:hypothetical protein P8452_13190 [Trifolium repens]
MIFGRGTLIDEEMQPLIICLKQPNKYWKIKLRRKLKKKQRRVKKYRMKIVNISLNILLFLNFIYLLDLKKYIIQVVEEKR